MPAAAAANRMLTTKPVRNALKSRVVCDIKYEVRSQWSVVRGPERSVVGCQLFRLVNSIRYVDCCK